MMLIQTSVLLLVHIQMLVLVIGIYVRINSNICMNTIISVRIIGNSIFVLTLGSSLETKKHEETCGHMRSLHM